VNQIVVMQVYKRLFVTGGLGFIGSNFIRYMLQVHPDLHIVNMDKVNYAGNLDNLSDVHDPRYSFVRADICDRKAVDACMMGTDAVINFAAESHVDRSIADAECFVRTNVLGTFQLLDSARVHGIKRFYHISTDEVFGSLSEDGRFSESSPYNPRNPYAATKAAADHLVRSFYHTHGLPIVISHACNNYGPYQFPEKVLPLFITNLLMGKKVCVYGDGRHVRSWLHVLDHCEAIDRVLHKGRVGHTYCIAADDEISNLSLTRMLLGIMGLPEERIEFVPDRKGHDYRYAIDWSKAQQDLGWRPKVSLVQGLAQTVDWYRENRDWWQPLK
jgi:dTDP-glucose 4,6-dehydratase